MKRKTAVFAGICLLLAAAACIYIVIALGGSPDKHIARITSDGKLVREIDLSAAQDDLFTVECDGGYNVVCVKNGEICVSEASCPDKICVHHGVLKSELLPIVCMPNKLVITLV